MNQFLALIQSYIRPVQFETCNLEFVCIILNFIEFPIKTQDESFLEINTTMWNIVALKVESAKEMTIPESSSLT